MKRISTVQETIWLTQNIYTRSSLYNVGGYAVINGPLQQAALVGAIEDVLSNTDVIEIGYAAFNDGRLSDNTSFSKYDIAAIDFSADVDPDKSCIDWMTADMNVVCEVNKNLLKIRLLKAADNKYYWYTKVHHLIFDGYSMSLFFNNVAVLYTTSINNEQAAMPQLYPYTDFINDEENYRASEEFAADRTFWLNRLKNIPPAKAFESFQKSANNGSLHSQRKETVISRELYNRIELFCKNNNCTAFHYFIATLFILNKSYNNPTPVIGLPVFNRRNKQFKHTIGTFVNMLPFAISVEDGAIFTDILSQVKNDLKDCYRHQRFPLFDILQELDGKDNIYNVSFSYQKNIYETKLGDSLASINYMTGGEQQDDLMFHLLEYTATEDLTLAIDYKEHLFTQDGISRLLNHFNTLLQTFLNNPLVPVDQLDYLSDTEKTQLLVDFNGAMVSYPRNKTLTALFEEQVTKTPDAIALVFAGQEFTYQSLNSYANQLGAYLRDHYQIQPDDLIGIKLERSEWMIISLLGVLKSGGAYVPIDPEYPQERIDYMLTDSHCKVLIDEEELEKFKSEASRYSKGNIVSVNKASDLAYVIYTSGSTGRPKGCMLEHQGVINRIEWMWHQYEFSARDIILQKTTFTFDVSVWELFMPLCWGVKMVLCQREDTVSPERILSLISKERVSCLHFVPGMLNVFISSLFDGADIKDGLSSLRCVMTSGEALAVETVMNWYKGVDVPVHNLYGPTEASIDVTYYATRKQDIRIPIGRPIWNTAIYVLGKEGQLVPVGVTGEICIGGDGLARGYLNKAGLTAEKFVANPFRPGERMYKTGDIGRWLPDGNVEYIGRKDDQVKVRGYRIELGEIENALQQLADIDAAVVTARGSKEKELVAYIVSKAVLNTTDIRSALGKILPSYMIPGYYVQLDTLPLSSNGKVDRKRLPDPMGLGMSTGTAYVAPRNKTEETLVMIWQELLGKDHIGIRDNFFDLGGHSLKATRLASQLHKTFDVKIALKDLFSTAVLKDQAALIHQSRKKVFTGITPVPLQPSYPLSAAQRRIWVLSQFGEGSTAYNMPGVFVFEGTLDLALLEYAFDELIARHESLRTIFREDEQGEVRQLILDTIPFNIACYDMQADETILKSLLQQAVAAPFDLSAGPLLRAGLYQAGTNKWIFTFTIHHIISDGWSMNVFIKELLLFYNTASNPLSPLKIQYKDFAFWQQEQLSEAALEEHAAYWLNQFSDELPVLVLPADKARPVLKSYNGGIVYKTINRELTQGLKNLVQEQQSTLFMGLLCAVNTLLHRYSGQEDIIIGSPVAGREHIELENQIGFYVNTLALRTRFSGKDSYRELLKNVKEITLNAYEHQVYPFDTLVDALQLQRDLSRSPLFDIMVVLQDKSSGPLELNNLSVSEYTGHKHTVSKFDLLFNFSETGDEIGATITYNSDIYTEATIERLSHHFVQLLEAATTHSNQAIEELDYLSEAETTALLSVFNNTSVPYPSDKTLIALFEEQVNRTPDHIALVFEGQSLRYSEVNAKANQLGAYLRKHYDVQPDDLIGIQLERSEWMIIALLGVLKSGGAYVPIDPSYPQDRIDYMLTDSECKVLINEDELSKFYTEADSYGSKNIVSVTRPADLAYLIYTSGSTGQPKGVMIEQRSLVSYLTAINAEYGLGGDDRVLQISNFAFDASVEQIFCSLLNGSALYIISNPLSLDGSELNDFIATHGITHLHGVPALLEKAGLTITHSLKRVISAGENCPLPLMNSLKEKVTFYNKYGPTEGTISTTIFNASEQAVNGSSIPIGRPVNNSRVYILDHAGHLLPVGITGEICIGGDGLARGYLNRTALTAEKFVADPFYPGERMYKTGDLGRWLPDGNVEYIGRKDDQVKVRGYRIELGEIENALQQLADIDAAVVTARGSKEKELVAYIVSKAVLHTSDIRAALGRSLPSYMIPGYYVQLDTLPLSSNGKVDRKRLPDPDGLGMSTGTAYVAPRNKTEETLVLIWQELLGKENIGIRDNFFDLGGHSLKATRLASQLHKTFDVKIALKDLFTTSVLEDQAALIHQSQKKVFTGITPVSLQSSYPLSAAQRRLWVLSQFGEGSVAYNMPGVFVFEGTLDLALLEYAFDELIARHESLRTIFREDELGEVRQVILDTIPFNIACYDMQADEVTLKSLLQQAVAAPFDLSTGPLLRAGLYQVGTNKWIFTCTMHHIISDGWSMNLLIKELLLFYNTASNPLSPLKIQYKDYASWQQDQLNSAALQIHKSYWLEQFSGELPVLELPSDKLRPSVKTYHGGIIHHTFSKTISAGIKALIQQEGGTLFMGLLGAVNTLLYRYTGQEDIIIGSPIAGREHIDLENQIGFYVNTLALRARFSGKDSYRELLGNIKQITLGAYEHQIYPFDELVDALPLKVDMSRNALFDVMVVLQNNEEHHLEGEQSLKGVMISEYKEVDLHISKFDLQFTFAEKADALQLAITYNSDIYEHATGERMACHLEQLLCAVIAAPSMQIDQLDYLSNKEKTQLLVDFNGAMVAYPRDKTLTALFEEQVMKTPDAIALVFAGQGFTYQELNSYANQLGAYLRNHYQIQPDDLVGIKLERSEWMIISILGTLKAGGAYVPIDIAYPQERIDYILTDCRCKVLIDEQELVNFQKEQHSYSEGNLVSANTPADLAYIMYTSGSTGNPKGVMVTHQNVVRLVKCNNYLDITGDEILLATGSVSFDATTFEYWMILLHGGKMILCRQEDLLDEQQLAATIKYYEVNTMWFTAGWLHQLVDKNINVFSGLKTILSGGDTLSAIHVNTLRQHYPGIRIINGYGPTENTVFSLCYEVNRECDNIPVGRPINNSTAYILDNVGKLLPLGITGEICVGGDGLARGYLNKPELTAQKFVTNPLLPGVRMYKTGDLGRWLPDGNIEFIGRKDNQVKIRGYRVELGEIENALQQLVDIDAAVVIAKVNGNGEKELIAYIVSKSALNIAVLRTDLGKVLPVYMLPAYYVQLDTLPLTSNGKLDRKKLPDPQELGMVSSTEYLAPRNATEETLVLIWQELLGKENIGIRDNFFELGGHSLKATRLASQLHKTFNVKIALKDLFTFTILEEQAALIIRSQKKAFTAITPVALQSSYPLSAAQRRLWVLSQFGEGSVAYNMPGVFVFEGTLDPALLEYAFNELITRHESLRTIFREDEHGEVRQVILDTVNFNLDVREGSSDIDNLVHEATALVFDLSRGPLLRAGLYRVGDNKWIFTCTMHHIISDGWSMNVLIKELLLFYNTASNPLSPLKIQYKDYASWQQEELSGAALQEHVNYWLEQFSGELPVLELPSDKLRPAVKTYHGGIIHHTFSKTISAGIKALIQQEGGTLFMGLLAAVNALLYRYTNQEDIIIGSPVAGREHIELENQIGFYVNTLALRTRFNGKNSYRELLEIVKNVTLGAYEHQIYPFDALVDELDLPRDMSHNALFDVMVVLQNNESSHLNGQSIPGLTISEYNGKRQHISKFDLQFTFVEKEDALQLTITYNSDIYDPATGERLTQHMEQLLSALIGSPSLPIEELDYLSEAETARLLSVFNNTSVPYPSDKTLVALFEEQVNRTSDHIALVFERQSLSYSEVNAKANQLGAYLRKHYDVQPDDLIGIQLERSEWMIIALLGVLKSGGAYVPIDPSYPQDRIDYMLTDSECKVLINEKELANFRKEQHSYSEDNLLSANRPADLAYVIYTSGSTGQPKGVMIEQRSLVNYLTAINAEYGLGGDDRVLQISNFAFDASVEQIFCSLLNGSALYIISNPLSLDGSELNDFIATHGITHLHGVPALLEKAGLTITHSLKRVISAGENCPLPLMNSLKEKVTFYNKYGPTEGTISTTIFNASEQAVTGSSIPIGRPVNNSRVYILDHAGHLLPVGITGEICIGGDGLARGYLNKAGLTAEKFVADPFQPGERMYKTGDLGRWLPDGNVEYIGRKDDQVKVRGYRIELGEIENALQQLADVDAAVVTAKGSKEKELVAYIVSKAVLNTTDIRAALGKTLPSYMIPGYYVQLDTLPLSSNGKVDRKRLPDPDGLGMSTGTAYVAPRNKTEETLVMIWQELLGKDHIGIRDNFFDLGGHSLKATRLASQLHKTFDVKISLKDLFSTAVLEDQAALIHQSQKKVFTGITPVPLQPSYPLSAAQRRIWVLSQFGEGSAAYNMPGVFVFEGTLDLALLEYAFDELIARHESLRTIFREDELGEVRQVILDSIDFNLDIREQSSDINNLIHEAASGVFDLSTGPLLRAGLYQAGTNKWIFTCTMHHIISDGWSMNVLIKELLLFYNTASNPLSPLKIQYKDYASWQQQQLSGIALQEYENYWLEQFSGELPVLELPSDKLRPSVKTYHGGIIHHTFNNNISTGIKSLSQQEGGTLFMGLLAAVNALLYRYTGQEDIIIGSPVAGREHIDLENQIGFYINTLALRTRFNGKNNYRELLGTVKQVALGAYDNQIYPFDTLIDKLNLPRDMSRNALFDVMVVLQNNEEHHLGGEQSLKGVMISEYKEVEQHISKFDMQFTFAEKADALQLTITYNSDIYEHATGERMARHLEQLLCAIIAGPSMAIDQLDYLSNTEKTQLLVDFNGAAGSYPRNKTLTALFEEQVTKTPDAIALVFAGQEFTYQSLNNYANQLGAYLRDHYQIQPDDLIGIKLERSEWMIISLLGVLKSGGAYVPIDPEYPQERIDYILTDSQCKVLIDAAELEKFKSEASRYSKGNIVSVNKASDLAYVIYTSGSTGRPKGCMLEHQGVINRIEWMWHQYEFSAGDIILQKTTFTFDVSVWELFMPLCWGAKMVLCQREDTVSPERILSLISKERVSCLHFVPGMLNVFISSLFDGADIKDGLSSLRCVMTSGEALAVETVMNWYKGADVPVHNLYGPTEASVDVTYYATRKQDIRIPIGRPIWNTAIYVLGKEGQLVPVGVTGEICIGGDGLARGYLNKAGLTAEKFVANPFRPGERMYKTGDIGRWLPDGNVEYIGRKDDQVKVRGYRIELGEIENALQQLADIDAAVVTAKGSKEKELVAYIVSKAVLNTTDIRAALGKILPSYMIPGYYVQLDTLPLSSNGKVDRKRLPDPMGLGMSTGTAYVAPRNKTEETLVMIWAEILGREKIGINDNFFELGGHSLKIAQLILRINAIFLIRISFPNIYKNPTVAGIAAQILFILDQNKQKQKKEKLTQIEI